jgi:hypothetical protein
MESPVPVPVVPIVLIKRFFGWFVFVIVYVDPVGIGIIIGSLFAA